MDKQLTNLLITLKKFINQSSYTFDKNGVNKMGELVQKELEDIDLEWGKTEAEKDAKQGDLLMAKTKKWNKSKPSILLIGHLDTVFKENWDWSIKDDKFFGPGGLDMKAGVLSMIETTKRLAKEKKLENLMLLFTPDEEAGMYHIDKQEEYYNQADVALVFEEATWDRSNINAKERALVMKRKAMSFYELTLGGPGGHNAMLTNAKDRHNIIYEIARIIRDLQELMDFDKGTLINVGNIEGGMTPNALAEKVTIGIDIRYGDSIELKKIKAELNNVFTVTDPEISIKVEETVHYPSFDHNPKAEKLADEIINIGKKLNLDIFKQFRSAGSEANWVANLNKDCIVFDGFGVVGAGDHSSSEYFFIETLLDSINLAHDTITHLLKN